MIVEGASKDIVTTNCFTGVNANFLRPSLLEHGLDPDNLQKRAGGGINIDGGGDNAKAWKEIWSAGQGIGAVKRAEPAGDWIDWLAADYAAARAAMGLTS
jgi:nitronate monooxygenase